MTIIWNKNGVVDDDPWITAGDEDDGKLLSIDEALDRARDNAPLGVLVKPADDVRALAPVVDSISFIALTFPVFSDGRAFSQAMLLRERLKYKSELRAIGTVLLDHVPLMLRVGIDSFEVSHEPTIERLKQQRLPGIDLHYQPSADAAKPSGGYSWRRTATLNG